MFSSKMKIFLISFNFFDNYQTWFNRFKEFGLKKSIKSQLYHDSSPNFNLSWFNRLSLVVWDSFFGYFCVFALIFWLCFHLTSTCWAIDCFFPILANMLALANFYFSKKTCIKLSNCLSIQLLIHIVAMYTNAPKQILL